jgi:hypothetical protein
VTKVGTVVDPSLPEALLSTSPPPPTPPPWGGPGRGAVAAVLAVGALVAALVVGAGLSSVGFTTGSAPGDDGPTGIATGASSDGYAVWARNDDGVPVRWDACSPIDLVLSPDGAPPGVKDDLDEAVARLVEATGLELRITGTTDERPQADRPPYQPDRYGHRWAPVLVAWARPHEGGIRLRTTDRGVAVPIAVGPSGDRTYVTAQVAFNADRTDLEPGFHDRSVSWGSTVLHELVHVLGLDHVADPTQLMYVHPGEGPVVLGEGDLAGLTAVGAQQGCRTVPHPGPVEVADPPR